MATFNMASILDQLPDDERYDFATVHRASRRIFSTADGQTKVDEGDLPARLHELGELLAMTLRRGGAGLRKAPAPRSPTKIRDELSIPETAQMVSRGLAWSDRLRDPSQIYSTLALPDASELVFNLLHIGQRMETHGSGLSSTRPADDIAEVLMPSCHYGALASTAVGRSASLGDSHRNTVGGRHMTRQSGGWRACQTSWKTSLIDELCRLLIFQVRVFSQTASRGKALGLCYPRCRQVTFRLMGFQPHQFDDLGALGFDFFLV